MIKPSYVKAASDDVIYRLDYISAEEYRDCEGIFGDVGKKDSVAYFLQQVFKIMGYAAPILCLVLSTFDFVKATASQDKDNLSKASKRTIKRVVLAIVLFFLPTLINFLFPLLGWYGTCGIE